MKNSIPFLLSFCLLVISLTGCQSEAIDENLYGVSFNSAKITYKISGTANGKSEMLIKGNKRKIQTESVKNNPDGTVENINRIQIINNKDAFQIDLINKKGIKVISELATNLAKLKNYEEKMQLQTQNLLDGIGQFSNENKTFKPTGMLSVAGKNCENYKNEIIERCIWEGILLREVVNIEILGSKLETIATKIELDKYISDDEFDLPKDIIIENQQK